MPRPSQAALPAVALAVVQLSMTLRHWHQTPPLQPRVAGARAGTWQGWQGKGGAVLQRPPAPLTWQRQWAWRLTGTRSLRWTHC